MKRLHARDCSMRTGIIHMVTVLLLMRVISAINVPLDMLNLGVSYYWDVFISSNSLNNLLQLLRPLVPYQNGCILLDKAIYCYLWNQVAIFFCFINYSRCTIDKIRTIEKNSKNDQKKMWEDLRIDDFQANIVKIVVNYLQVLGVITDYSFDWPSQIDDANKIVQKFIPTDKDSFSIDCILSLSNHF